VLKLSFFYLLELKNFVILTRRFGGEESLEFFERSFAPLRMTIFIFSLKAQTFFTLSQPLPSRARCLVSFSACGRGER
jgi:hypothetical protein